VWLLVERDDVAADAKDKHGRTPLSWAAARGHEAVVRLLVERDDVAADAKCSTRHRCQLHTNKWNRGSV
jgi:ankyrin repeat protein